MKNTITRDEAACLLKCERIALANLDAGCSGDKKRRAFLVRFIAQLEKGAA